MSIEVSSSSAVRASPYSETPGGTTMIHQLSKLIVAATSSRAAAAAASIPKDHQKQHSAII
jgi:hypothetical protein